MTRFLANVCKWRCGLQRYLRTRDHQDCFPQLLRKEDSVMSWSCQYLYYNRNEGRQDTTNFVWNINGSFQQLSLALLITLKLFSILLSSLRYLIMTDTTAPQLHKAFSLFSVFLIKNILFLSWKEIMFSSILVVKRNKNKHAKRLDFKIFPIYSYKNLQIANFSSTPKKTVQSLMTSIENSNSIYLWNVGFMKWST